VENILFGAEGDRSMFNPLLVGRWVIRVCRNDSCGGMCDWTFEAAMRVSYAVLVVSQVLSIARRQPECRVLMFFWL
jgi:hypothetical protein